MKTNITSTHIGIVVGALAMAIGMIVGTIIIKSVVGIQFSSKHPIKPITEIHCVNSKCDTTFIYKQTK